MRNHEDEQNEADEQDEEDADDDGLHGDDLHDLCFPVNKPTNQFPSEYGFARHAI